MHENKWLNPRDTTVWFRADSGFGQKIRFQPYRRLIFRFWKDHPAVDLLRERINRAQSMSEDTG